MSATDELRKLLNERDVEHSDFTSAYRLSTRWQDSNRRVIEHQIRKDADIGDMGIVRNLTPEQVISATLDNGECKLEPIPALLVTMNMLNEIGWCKCSECGYATPEDSNYCHNCGRKVVVE